MCVQLEAEAASIEDPTERAEMLEGFGLGEGALFRMVRSAYHLLGLRTFLTTGDKESRAWTFYEGSTAPQCAGRIHTDFQRGFIRAEVIDWQELLDIGAWNKAKELGKIRLEGKDYIARDGDVMEFRFNVCRVLRGRPPARHSDADFKPVASGSQGSRADSGAMSTPAPVIALDHPAAFDAARVGRKAAALARARAAGLPVGSGVVLTDQWCRDDRATAPQVWRIISHDGALPLVVRPSAVGPRSPPPGRRRRRRADRRRPRPGRVPRRRRRRPPRTGPHRGERPGARPAAPRRPVAGRAVRRRGAPEPTPTVGRRRPSTATTRTPPSGSPSSTTPVASATSCRAGTWTTPRSRCWPGWPVWPSGWPTPSTVPTTSSGRPTTAAGSTCCGSDRSSACTCRRPPATGSTRRPLTLVPALVDDGRVDETAA